MPAKAGGAGGGGAAHGPGADAPRVVQINADGTKVERLLDGTTVPVGSLPANAFGLHEVHGNASEWCSDWYDDQDYPPGATIDPLGPPPSGSHLRRGGAYGGENAYMLRAAFRIGVQGEGETREYVGFRVAASLPTK